jgi:hypothetical protein
VKHTIVCLSVIAALAATRHAHACGQAGNGAAFVAYGALMTGVVVGSAVVIGGNVVTTVGGSVALAKKRPSLGFGIAGLVVGSLDVVFASLALAYGDRSDFNLGMSITFLAVGATNLGLGIANLAWRPKKPLDRAHLDVSPLFGRDATGRPMTGVGLRFVL